MYQIVRTSDEIDDLLNEVAEAEDEGRTRFSGMTFEQGIAEMYRWLTERDADHPYPPE